MKFIRIHSVLTMNVCTNVFLTEVVAKTEISIPKTTLDDYVHRQNRGHYS